VVELVDYKGTHTEAAEGFNVTSSANARIQAFCIRALMAGAALTERQSSCVLSSNKQDRLHQSSSRSVRPDEASVYPESHQPRSHPHRRSAPVHHALRNSQPQVGRPEPPGRGASEGGKRGNGGPLTTTMISAHTIPEVTNNVVLSAA
jgi:hypothetical protein